MTPYTTKMMSSQMKEMGGMMNKNMAMDAGSQKQMEQIRKDTAASRAQK